MTAASVLISRTTDVPRMKLASGRVPGVIVPVAKQLSKWTIPPRPKLPSEDAPSCVSVVSQWIDSPPLLVRLPAQLPVIEATENPVALPRSPLAQPPVTVYVPVNVSGKPIFSVMRPSKVITWPSIETEVSETAPLVTVPLRPIAVRGSKQPHPSRCSVPISDVPDWLILPVSAAAGSSLETEDVALNCQLPPIACEGGLEGGPDPKVEFRVCCVPHPQNKTTTQMLKMFTCFIVLPSPICTFGVQSPPSFCGRIECSMT